LRGSKIKVCKQVNLVLVNLVIHNTYVDHADICMFEECTYMVIL